jgi:hypothetical protein
VHRRGADDALDRGQWARRHAHRRVAWISARARSQRRPGGPPAWRRARSPRG